MNRLVLIDGNAILHRAYHALPPLTAPDGQPVNAVYGFVSILIKLFQDLKPTHMAVAFDRPEKTFRKSLYKDYQGKRPEMDADLVSQIPKVQDMVRAFGIPIYDKAGYEADDVIGTVCRQITNPKHQIPNKSQAPNSNVSNIDEVIIVTGDKDILQLVDDARRVKVFMPTKGLSEGKLYGEVEVVERLGVTPKQIPELKALMGDSSDNYPGVAGIGPKTAVGIITHYGDIDALYRTVNNKPSTHDITQHHSNGAWANDRGIRVLGKQKAGKREGKKLSAHSSSPRLLASLNRRSGSSGEAGQLSAGVIEKLRNGEEMARMSKDLATIRTDVPVKMGELAPLETLDTPEAREKLGEFHFPSLLKRLTGVQDDKTGGQEGPPPLKLWRARRAKEKAGEQQELF
ncbi:MAG: 5'-3' exonuclease H3TH domain-containing protein [Candidatus Gottesmanbacteria bacterium]|nr:5'-3' exonuclease H3TH domain-containing protein [Candidatus Gottesmanbacteria bacterium]